MPRVLLTGFGPFGTHQQNPTETIVKSFPSLLPIKNPFGRGASEVSIEKHVLSVDKRGAHWTADELEHREWDAILHLVCAVNALFLGLNFALKIGSI